MKIDSVPADISIQSPVCTLEADFGPLLSILGSILTGLALGLIEGLTKVFYPEASSIVVFVIMAIVLMIRPAGLFGKEK